MRIFCAFTISTLVPICDLKIWYEYGIDVVAAAAAAAERGVVAAYDDARLPDLEVSRNHGIFFLIRESVNVLVWSSSSSNL